jgi:flagellar protein FliO/FliZ
MPRGRQRVFVLCLLVLFLIPVSWLGAQESLPRPAIEETLLILDTEESAGSSQEAGDDQEVQGGPLVSSWDFLRMVLILAAIIGVIYLIFWMIKRGFKRQLPQNDLIHLLGTRNLTSNRALHLVELGKQIFLVGAAEGSISLISEIKDQETLDSIILERSQNETRAPQGFADFLRSFLKSGKGSSVGSTVDFMKQQRQRLEKL